MIRKVKCASYCWPDTLSTLGDERCGAVLMPLLYKAIAQRWRARGVGRDRVQAFKIVGREMHLHQESAAPGRSRATRREHDGKGKTKAEFRRSLGAAGSLLRNPRAPSDGQRQRPVCGFAKPCVSVPGIHPGKLTGVSPPF